MTVTFRGILDQFLRQLVSVTSRPNGAIRFFPRLVYHPTDDLSVARARAKQTGLFPYND